MNISATELITLYREWCQASYGEAYLNGRPFMPPNPDRMKSFTAWLAARPQYPLTPAEREVVAMFHSHPLE